MSKKTKNLWLVPFLAFVVVQAFGKDEGPTTEMGEERVAVEDKLAGEDHLVALVVNGLRCPSCAIGIGKKVSRLEFIDTDRLHKGVKVHRKESLLTVAIEQNSTVDLSSLADAIRKAGFDPVRFYAKDKEGCLKVTEISESP